MLNKAILLTTKGSGSYDMEYEVTFGGESELLGYDLNAFGSSITKKGDVDLSCFYTSEGSSSGLVGFVGGNNNDVKLGDYLYVINLTTNQANFAYKSDSYSTYFINGIDVFKDCVNGETYLIGINKVNMG